MNSKLAVLGTSSVEEPVRLMDNVKEMKQMSFLRADSQRGAAELTIAHRKLGRVG